jgi:hypothetical protein
MKLKRKYRFTQMNTLMYTNRMPAANKRLAQWRVTWLIEHSASHQHLWYIDSFVLRNPPLRQAPNRQSVQKPIPAKIAKSQEKSIA